MLIGSVAERAMRSEVRGGRGGGASSRNPSSSDVDSELERRWKEAESRGSGRKPAAARWNSCRIEWLLCKRELRPPKVLFWRLCRCMLQVVLEWLNSSRSSASSNAPSLGLRMIISSWALLESIVEYNAVDSYGINLFMHAQQHSNPL